MIDQTANEARHTAVNGIIMPLARRDGNGTETDESGVNDIWHCLLVAIFKRSPSFIILGNGRCVGQTITAAGIIWDQSVMKIDWQDTG